MAEHGPKLPANVRKAVAKVTEKIFKDSDRYQSHYKHRNIRRGNEYVSSLPLQMAFYFNCFFFPIWVVSSAVTYQAKYEHLSDLYKIVTLSILVMMCVVEVIRIYLGYLGNLTEKVPELAGSWLLTILLQLPSSLFVLLNEATQILPLERAMNLVLTIFVVLEIIIGGVAIKVMVNHQVALFHAQQIVKADELGDAVPFTGDTTTKPDRYNPSYATQMSTEATMNRPSHTETLSTMNFDKKSN